jgi:hypothetical protein
VVAGAYDTTWTERCRGAKLVKYGVGAGANPATGAGANPTVWAVATAGANATDCVCTKAGVATVAVG